jgi:hypothetical protein
MMRRFIYIAVAVLALSACQFNVDEVLLSRSDISLTIKGNLQMSFDENSCQLGYNTGRNEFRVYDDKLANYFILRCSAKPTSEGQVLKADLEYTTATDSKTISGLEFTVEKTSPEGLLWLWNKDRQIGVVIKNL